MDSILKMMHSASVNDTFKVVRFLRNGVLKCRYFDSIQMAGPHILLKNIYLYSLLNESNTKFSGVDGSFYFLNNSIERDLDILKIMY